MSHDIDVARILELTEGLPGAWAVEKLQPHTALLTDAETGAIFHVSAFNKTNIRIEPRTPPIGAQPTALWHFRLSGLDADALSTTFGTAMLDDSGRKAKLRRRLKRDVFLPYLAVLPRIKEIVAATLQHRETAAEKLGRLASDLGVELRDERRPDRTGYEIRSRRYCGAILRATRDGEVSLELTDLTPDDAIAIMDLMRLRRPGR